MSIQVYQSYDEIVEIIKKADDLYYNDPDNATLPDSEYDALYDHLITLERDSPEITRADSPTQRLVRVGNLWDKVRHQRPMLSLEKVTEADDLERFVVGIGIENTMEVSAKVDGMALNLDYDERGRLIRAVSRGDGTTGENLTQNAVNVIGIPQKIETTFACSVRGEVVIPVEKFELIKDEYANPRNAAAGGMRGSDPAEAKKRHLHFLAYDLATEDESITSSEQAAAWLQTAGFSIPATTFVKGAVAVANAVDELFSRKDTLAYETDGVVIKASDFKVRASFENRTKSPRWAVAFKRAGEVAITLLNSVSWQVAKTGIISPVAELQPVALSGVTIKRATLHNMKYIDDMGLEIGDTVKITRAGDIIPRVLEVAAKTGSTKIAPPTTCPSCNSNVEVYSDSKIARCTNPLSMDCPEQLKGKLVAWASRKAGNIDAIGETWIDTLVEAGVLTRPSSFYKLSERHLFGFDRMGPTLAEKFVDSINTSRNVGLRRALIGFSIPFASEGTAKRLCKHFDSIEMVAAATVSDLAAIEDIGDVVAKSLVDFFNVPENIEEIATLRQLGVNLDRLPEDEPVVVAAGSPFANKKVCITGTLSEPRSHYQSLLEGLGAKVSSSVSKNTDYLLAGEKAGSKLQKASEYGTVVLTEDDLNALIGA